MTTLSPGTACFNPPSEWQHGHSKQGRCITNKKLAYAPEQMLRSQGAKWRQTSMQTYMSWK
eukprot:5143985-Amphidinium_carterae.2